MGIGVGKWVPQVQSVAKMRFKFSCTTSISENVLVELRCNCGPFLDNLFLHAKWLKSPSTNQKPIRLALSRCLKPSNLPSQRGHSRLDTHSSKLHSNAALNCLIGSNITSHVHWQVKVYLRIRIVLLGPPICGTIQQPVRSHWSKRCFA